MIDLQIQYSYFSQGFSLLSLKCGRL